MYTIRVEIAREKGGKHMKRKIVSINEELCNGCELCVNACHEGAIQMIDGKAKLVSDIYCDGLGDCLPACPTDAIKIIERDADEYSQEAVDERMKEIEATGGIDQLKGKKETEDKLPCGCPGTMSKKIERPTDGINEFGFDAVAPANECGCNDEDHEKGHKHGHHHSPENPCGCSDKEHAMGEKHDHKHEHHGHHGHHGHKHHGHDIPVTKIGSQLQQWPVQLRLINPNADYLKNADLLIAADCTAFAYGDFHRDFIKGRVTIIACPKLDDNDYNIDKLAEIIANNEINSITVVRMEVPCCTGIVGATKKAMLNAQKIVKYNEVTIGLDGEIRK